MARYTIYSPTGTALYTGTPTFTGQYMKPGLLEFREVSVPRLLALEPGCYVDYDRTGYRYRIYAVPQIKKQARSRSYGGAFVFQGVQLYDPSKQLEYCPFRDLVKGDNRIHFSTQPSISTYEGVDGLARRFEACLRDQYDVNGVQSWAVRIATPERDGVDSDLYAMMLEPREFTVSGVNILECLDKVYEIWPDVGWVYAIENGIDTIIIGGGGINANNGTYAYGKGRGLTSLTRVAANAEEIANRIFAYGSNQNMLPRWYNSQQIKDAESVDIQNLMLPINQVDTYPGWGLTEGLPDAAKAYVEDSVSIEKNGLRPATVYFDGSGEYPAIYPSIRDTTIKMVRLALGSSSAKYYPSTTVYTDEDERIDRVLSAPATFDSGKAGADGKAAVKTDSEGVTFSDSGTVIASIPAFTKLPFNPFYTKTVAVDGASDYTLKLNVPVTGTATLTGALGYLAVVVRAYRINNDSTETLVGERETKMEQSTTDSTAWTFKTASLTVSRESFAAGQSVRFEARVVIAKTVQNGGGAYTISLTGNASYSVAFFRAKTFTISIRQVGFDINEQAALGDGKTIAMRSGKCAGRSFAINDVQYDEATDSWMLECWRTEDESLSQWFPNTDYPIEADDEFVLLDIAMPETYIGMAETKLLQAAQELLADSAVERWQYTPEIDAKYMIENHRIIRAGDFMVLIDRDLIEGSGDDDPDDPDIELRYFQQAGGGYYLTRNDEEIAFVDDAGAIRIIVDTIVINEGESAIPTYKVTLRDRKKKTWTASESPTPTSTKSVGNTDERDAAQYIDLSNYVTTDMFESLSSRVATLEAESFFMLDTDGNITLKAAYQNLWVPGWLAAGGVGTGGGGGGGGGSSTLADLLDVSLSGLANGDVLTFNSSTNHWQNTAKSTFLSDYATKAWVQQQGYALSSAIPTEATVSGWGFTKNAGTVTSVKLLQGTGISITDSGTAITTSGERTISITNTYQQKINNGDTAYSWGNHANQGYIKSSDLAPLSDRISAVERWFSVVTVNGAETLKLNPAFAGLWAEGWVSAGGVGSGGGGNVVALSDLVDVSLSGLANGHLLVYDAATSHWKNVAQSTIVPTVSVAFSDLTSHPTTIAGYGITDAYISSGTIHLGSASITPALQSDLNALSTRVTTIEGWFEVVTVDGVQALHAKSGRAIYSDSWIAAGGVGSGSSGGGLDVARMWQSLTNNPADAGYENTKIAVAHIPNITTSKITDLESWISGKGYVTGHQAIYTLTLQAGSFTAGTYTPNSAAKTIKVPTTLDHIADGTNRKLSDYALASDLSALATRVTSIEDWFEIVNVGTSQSPEYALHAKQGRAIYSDSWIAAGGVGSGNASGGLITRVRSISDLGTTISTESLTETFSAKAIEGIYEAVQNLANAGYATQTWVQTWVQNQGYLTSRGYIGTTAVQASSEKQALAGILEIGLTNSGSTVSGKIIPISLGGQSLNPQYGLRWQYQYISQASLNPELVTVNKTIAFTDDIPTPKKLYFGSTTSGNYYDTTAQKVLDASLINGVTLTTDQTITGRKTFSQGSGGIMMNGANILTSADSTNQIGAADSRFQNAYIRNVFLTYLGFRTDDGQTHVGNFGMGSGYAQVAIVNGNSNSVYTFNATYGFFHGGDGNVPCGRSDHRWEKVWTVDADLSGGLVIGGDIVPAADVTSSLGYSTRRFTSGNIVNVHTRNIYFKHQTTGKTDGLIAGGDGYFRIRTGADIDTAYKDIMFHETYGFYPEQSGVNLGYGSAAQYRWANIYGVNADLSGDLTLAATSHIDIGVARIEYDSSAKAIHITKASGNDDIGLYADSFVAAGGLGTNGQTIRYVALANDAAYAAITTKDPSTIYTIGGSIVTKIYLGTTLLFSEN